MPQRRLTAWLALAISCSLALLAHAATAPDPRLKPGNTFYLEFPRLQPNRKGEPTRMQVRIPDEYDPVKSFPLIAWMGGGDGGDTIGSAAKLADTKKFVMVGLPYPKGANNPGQANMVGNFPEIWRYQKAMLDELHHLIPNISPHLRVISGFSNGGHCIDGLLSVRGSGFLDYFNTFILSDGGMATGDYAQGRGRHLYICWGETSPNRGTCMAVAQKARSAGMRVMASEQKKTGHKFDDEHQAEAAKWLQETVVGDLVKEGSAQLQARVKSKRYEGCYKLAQFLIVLGPPAPGDAKDGPAVVLQQMGAAADSEWEKIKTDDWQSQKPPAKRDLLRKLELFESRWAGTPAGARCHELADELKASLAPAAKK